MSPLISLLLSSLYAAAAAAWDATAADSAAAVCCAAAGCASAAGCVIYIYFNFIFCLLCVSVLLQFSRRLFVKPLGGPCCLYISLLR